MSGLANRSDLLHRWKAALSRLERCSTRKNAIADWHGMLYAKVLRYLVARHEDEGCWNRHAVDPQTIATSSRAVESGRSESKRLAPRAVLPRSPQEMAPRLQWIHAANAQSYQEFSVTSQ
jgi:hypothetical protein